MMRNVKCGWMKKKNWPVGKTGKMAKLAKWENGIDASRVCVVAVQSRDLVWFFCVVQMITRGDLVH